MRKRPKLARTAVEGTVRRTVRVLDRTEPIAKGELRPDRLRRLDQAARRTLGEDVRREVDAATAFRTGEPDHERALRIDAIAAGRVAGLSPARAAADHATVRARKLAEDDPPPTPREGGAGATR